ncbi:hypothetical protein AALB39_04380 [Lachnospiraceae bacterium 54-53]
MEKLTLKENNEMVLENMSIDEILANSQNGVIEALKRIVHEDKKRDARIEAVEKNGGKNTTEINELKKNTNVICSPFHSKRRKNFTKICKGRVWYLFNGENDTAEYILFSHFLFKKIYGDVASHFDLDSWHDLSMENYDQENSIYAQAKEIAQYWTPSNWYIKECVKDLINKRDKGLLSPERCRALTEYLKVTNNGEINPFSA